MSSDKAQISYDEQQRYRSVVMQQGRVTLEADWNEAQQIVNEEIRKEALDFVGPSGTPDDGYRVMETGVAPTPPFNFTVGPGTMYVGGMRVQLDEATQYSGPAPSSGQTEWRDFVNDPDWVNLPGSAPPREFVYLSLREQEVTAVEDAALREVALGGPDTAARTRLIQRIVRTQVSATDCEHGLSAQRGRWNSQGLDFDDETMRLLSRARLRVSFPPQSSTPDPCEPTVQGGFLGADNQLIRVKVVSFNTASNTGRLVWGYDNASFLYRVELIDNRTLRLRSRPVDAFHQPRVNQTVEVLRTAAYLKNKWSVASATGFVVPLSAAYVPDTQRVTLQAALPAEYVAAAPPESPGLPPGLFLRVWEEELSFTPGAPVTLGATGMQVTLQTTGTTFHPGDFWQIAARPGTPTQVYPRRYLEAPQPPDGPRLWACPLALVEWQDNLLTVLEDCRNHFDNLVELTRRAQSCCTITIKPEDITGRVTLQTIVDKLALRREDLRLRMPGEATCKRNQLVICFTPGCYSLKEPLRLDIRHSNLKLEGCREGAVIQVNDGDEDKFLDGMIVMNRANEVTISGLRFELPQVSVEQASEGEGLPPVMIEMLGEEIVENLNVSIGIRPIHCAELTIKDCLFRYSIMKAPDVFPHIFGVGIFAGSECWGLKLEGNRFVRTESYLRRGIYDQIGDDQEPIRVFIGYLLAPTVILKGRRKRKLKKGTATVEATATVSEARGLAGCLRFIPLSQRMRSSEADVQAEAAETSSESAAPGGEEPQGKAAFTGKQLDTRRNVSAGPEGDKQLVAAARNRQEVLNPYLEDALIRDNLFASLSAAVVIFADAGVVRLEDNTVRDCVVGFTISTMNATEGLLWSKDEEIMPPDTEVWEVFINMNLTGDLLRNILFLSMSYPLPSGVNANELLGREQRRRKPPELRLSLNIAHNDIESFVRKGASGPGILVLDAPSHDLNSDDRDRLNSTNSKMILSSNQVRNRSADAPTVFIIQIELLSVTGNLILNEGPGTRGDENIRSFMYGASIVARQTKRNIPLAVTGNVFQGVTNLASILRTGFTGPLHTWEFANTEI